MSYELNNFRFADNDNVIHNVTVSHSERNHAQVRSVTVDFGNGHRIEVASTDAGVDVTLTAGKPSAGPLSAGTLSGNAVMARLPKTPHKDLFAQAVNLLRLYLPESANR